jgi:hypothetical protein
VLRQHYVAGEKPFAGYCGPTVPVVVRDLTKTLLASGRQS